MEGLPVEEQVVTIQFDDDKSATIKAYVKDSVVLLEQIRTLDKRRLKERIGHMTENDMKKVNRALAISLNLE